MKVTFVNNTLFNKSIRFTTLTQPIVKRNKTVTINKAVQINKVYSIYEHIIFDKIIHILNAGNM